VTPAGAKLDGHLAASIKEFGGSSMPEIGGKSLANNVRIGLDGLKKKLEALRLDAAAAVNELATEINNGEEGVKRIRSETAEVKVAFAEILGNEGGQL
jgi:hypothetical protein